MASPPEITVANSSLPRRIALYGGSFDPPHNGHLAIAEAAMRTLSLDRVLFAPVARQPLKINLPQVARFHHRVAMTRLAIANYPNFELSLLDAPTGDDRPNYSAETLRRLRTELPSDTELFFLVGADSLRQFARWHKAAEIPFLASLIVASRPGESQDVWATPKSWLPHALRAVPDSSLQREASSPVRFMRVRHPDGRAASIYFLDNIYFDISATRLRQWLSQAYQTEPTASVRNLLPQPVLEYILEHDLYRDWNNPED